ncbi:MAG: hypothetical protein GYA31_03060 [Parcubacteria group bacterium]|nr:hypothetical protein [Parcubacteria group bacterium]
MKEGEGIQRWLAIMLIIIIIAIIILAVLFLPKVVKAENSYKSFSFQVQNKQAVIETTDSLGKRLSMINLIAAPIIKNDRFCIAVRDLENFGITITWIEETKTVVLKSPNNIHFEYRIGSRIYLLNKEKHRMDIAPFIENGRTFIPIRYFAQALGAKEIIYIVETKSVILTWLLGID